MHQTHGEELGERVLMDVLQLAQERWGTRLVAVYALGSLAHGGFSSHVSDVDVGLLLRDPLHERDAERIEQLSRTVKESGAPLTDRLSVFWGSILTCSESAGGGRFPPVDRLDLRQSGRLLFGEDIRSKVPSPSVREMVASAAAISLKSLSTAEVRDQLKRPARLMQAGVRPLTKRILFPVRFLFTARTGRIGATDLAVEHFCGMEQGPAGELAEKALGWRYAPPHPADPSVLACIEKGLLPLHRIYIEDYEARLLSYGESRLAQGFRDLRRLYGFDAAKYSA